ncbi:MAG: folate-binding protein [Alphaproteobacteria bacterium]|nr:MAG: folate-binding protein [Alphaproteobacteria bacterium]TAF15183.1 MAG: folate-binding protein [Alphaproteobacteria bacterium]TAF41500.1 MAG: folate-binding protein [Alphaproteobacteria bacterium]TAF77024.1 MAG: folate-binding protein [Alphaproteobacteria bacterium]
MTDLCILHDRTILHLSGMDAATFLQGLITQDVQRTVNDGVAQLAVFLTPQGKVLYDFIIMPAPHEEGLWLDSARAALEPLTKQLQRYRLRSKVQWRVRDDLSIVVSAHHSHAPTDALCWFADPRHAALGWRGVVPLSLSSAWNAGDDAYEARRIACGVVEAHRDATGERFFPLELGYEALNAIDYRKGCYVGQEVTARTHYKGTLRKGIAIISAPTPITCDDPLIYVTGQERSCGELLSYHGTSGLALVRYDAWRHRRDTRAAMMLNNTPIEVRLPDWGTLPEES